MENNIFNNLQEANERLDAIIENSFDGIYITDNKANTIKVNKSYEVITGLKKEEVLGKNMIDLIKNNVIKYFIVNFISHIVFNILYILSHPLNRFPK